MGALYDLCQKVTQHLERTYPDPIGLIRAKGEVATRAGFLVSLVGPGDYDDPDKITRLRRAVRELDIPA